MEIKLFKQKLENQNRLMFLPTSIPISSLPMCFAGLMSSAGTCCGMYLQIAPQVPPKMLKGIFSFLLKTA